MRETRCTTTKPRELGKMVSSKKAGRWEEGAQAEGVTGARPSAAQWPGGEEVEKMGGDSPLKEGWP